MSKPARKSPRAPGYDGRMTLAPAVVDDPNPALKGKTQAVIKNTSCSPLLLIYHRDRLKGPGETTDDANVRFIAGTKFRALYERAEMGGSRAIDYSALKVDVSFVYRDIPESAGEAMLQLSRASRKLGPYYPAIRSVIGEEVKFADWADQRACRAAGTQDKLDAYQHLREGLDVLVKHWGVAVGENRAKIRAEALDNPKAVCPK